MSFERKPFWAKCRCGYIWVAAYCGMDLVAFSQLLKSLRCPMCARGSKEITPAKQTDGRLDEPAQTMLP